MKDKYIVHTPNVGEELNYRFQEHYLGKYENYDRLTICGIPNELDNTLSVGIAFCCYPDNFSRNIGTIVAESRAAGFPYTKPYAVVPLDEFTQEACLEVLYTIHAELVSKTIKEVKKELSKQIVK